MWWPGQNFFSECSGACLSNRGYFLACIEPLGMTDGQILDRMITASSHREKAYGHFARLHNTPKNGNPLSYWQPSDSDQSPILRVSFPYEMQVTAIGIQGHYDKNVQEFASSIWITYYSKTSRKWISYSKNGNRRVKFSFFDFFRFRIFNLIFHCVY